MVDDVEADGAGSAWEKLEGGNTGLWIGGGRLIDIGVEDSIHEADAG